jgi:hypothetical protein
LAVKRPEGEGVHRYFPVERRGILILWISLAVLASKREFNIAEFQVRVEEICPKEKRSFTRRKEWG